MPMTPTLFTIEGLAVETGRDRRTVARILRNVPPDGVVKGHNAWRLATVLPRLSRREQGDGGCRSGDAFEAASARATELAQQLQDGFDRARGIADLGQRRTYLEQIGPLVGKLEDTLNEFDGGADDFMSTIAREHILAGNINTFLGLMEMELSE